MLNISNNSVSEEVNQQKYTTLEKVEGKKSSKVLKKVSYTTLIIIILIMFLPWTQNVRSTGKVSTLLPNQKPQNLNSIIDGRIENWFVKEGDFVKQGDTILKISEIKDEYFDDELLTRTKNQVNLKEKSVDAYTNKIDVQQKQLAIVKEQRNLKLAQTKNKLQQAKLKVQNDSLAYIAAALNLKTTNNQFQRADSLFKKGLISKVDFEKRQLKFQDNLAYELEYKNKWLNSKNDVINLKIELSPVEMKYQQDFNKLTTDRLETISSKLDTETNLNKLQNSYSNYLFRNGLYFITAPQDGYITKTVTSGIGETLKAGDNILTLMPDNYELAIELFVDPIDLPLMKIGEKVRVQFDGWPAIVFSGWPQASHGTFGGEIYAIDQFISENGKFRLLVREDKEDVHWPDAIRYGTGTNNLIMLTDVPIWYELWRKINGFPPEYYQKNKVIIGKKK